MASPPTLTPGEIESWGPTTRPEQVRVERVLVLLAAHLGVDKNNEAAPLVMALAGRHRYLLLEQISQTKHAAVYVAIDQMLARKVALKMHLDECDDISRWNVFREARTQVLFEDENIVRILDVGEHEDLSFTVTELCDTDLGAWSMGKPWRVVIRGIIEAGRGLEALHAAGFVHCDVKPANILVRDGVAKLGDFGMTSSPGRTEEVAGTPGYIAPEAAAGLLAPSGDVFGLASAAWVCLFGVLPYRVPTPNEADDLESTVKFLIEQALEGAVLDPPTGCDVPPELVERIRRGLAPHPRMRSTLSEWLRGLERCVSARPKRRRFPRGVAGAGVGGLGLGVFATLATLAVLERGPPVQRAPLPGPQDVLIEIEPPSKYLAECVEYERKRSMDIATAFETRELAIKLIEEAESPETASPTNNARLASYMAGQLDFMATSDVDSATAENVIARANAILSRSSRPSRPD